MAPDLTPDAKTVYFLSVYAFPTNHADPISYTLGVFSRPTAEYLADLFNYYAHTDPGHLVGIIEWLTGNDLSWADRLEAYHHSLVMSEAAAWEDALTGKTRPPADPLPTLDELPLPLPEGEEF